MALIVAAALASSAAAGIVVNRGNVASLQVIVDATGVEGSGNVQTLQNAAAMLASQLERKFGAAPRVAAMAESKPGPHIVIALAQAYPKLAGDLPRDNPDAFAIRTQGDAVYVLGAHAMAAQNGVATLLLRLGYRDYAPSPRWRLAPEGDALTIDLNLVDAPALRERSYWYAYGTSSTQLNEWYRQWAAANRLGSSAPLHCGHSYGNIIQRNKDVFDANPEFYAMNEAGQRVTDRAPAASKFCFSNPGLLKLVAEDRLRLLRERQAANPLEFMVSVDPSDGRGTCHCEKCKAIGTPTDRVIYLANHVARYLRQHDPRAWVGLYAYSTHREPPTIAVEPNVYIQVAMGFNRTGLTLPELISRWADKAGAVGIREYYAVMEWDWGLPGRIRGSHVEYLARWTPYYHQRRLNGINSQGNGNWAAQMPGITIATRLMWNPSEPVEPMVEEFYQRAFGKAQPAARRLFERMNRAPQLEAPELIAMFDDLAAADAMTQDPAVKARLVDLMAYLQYVALFREFNLAQLQDPGRGDVYYNALRPLLQFAWRIAERDMVHYQGLARRLANGLPLTDGRFDYWMMLTAKNRPDAKRLEAFKVSAADLPDSPVWMQGEPCSDDEIRVLFAQTRKSLASDKRTGVLFSRYLDYAHASGTDAGPSRSPGDRVGAARVEGLTTLWIGSVDEASYPLEIAPLDGSVEVVSYLRENEEHERFKLDAPGRVTLSFARANDYRVTLRGALELQTGADLPMALEASPQAPLTVKRSGPLYFYVPRGVSTVRMEVAGSAVVHIPRHGTKAIQGGPGLQSIAVPDDAAGTLWHFTADTDATLALVNVPPLLHLHRTLLMSVREVSQSDGLTTMTPQDVEAGRWKP
jgi:hypothetical protein